MTDPVLLSARAEYYGRAEDTLGGRSFCDYVRRHNLDIGRIGWHAGVTAVLPIIVCPAGRFEFADRDGLDGFICEAYAADGETVIDLVAWTLDDPTQPMTMFGRCGLLGLWQAMAPGTYYMGGRLQLHPSPLAWLQSGCEGAAIADRDVAGYRLLEVPGQIAVQDQAQGRDLSQLLRRAANIDNRVVAPASARRAA